MYRSFHNHGEDRATLGGHCRVIEKNGGGVLVVIKYHSLFELCATVLFC